MVVYKVVRRNGSAFKSAVVDTVGLCLHYAIGKTTTAPEGTKLFVFMSKTEAEAWSYARMDTRVLECQTCDSPQLIEKVGDAQWCMKKLLQWWARLICYCDSWAPRGTYGVTSLTPTREVSAGW